MKWCQNIDGFTHSSSVLNFKKSYHQFSSTLFQDIMRQAIIWNHSIMPVSSYTQPSHCRLFSFAVITHHHQKEVGDEMVYVCIHISIHPQGKSGQEPGDRNWNREHGRVVFAASLLWLFSFLYTTSSAMAPPVTG